MAIKTISLHDFRKLFDAGASVDLVDVRTPAEYARVHVKGARLIPLDRLNPSAILSDSRDPNHAIYVICQSGGRSAKACEQLQAAGLENVFSVEGGTAAWERAGFPVERRGGRVISLERQVRITAGLLVLLGACLAIFVHRAFIGLDLFVGAGLVFAGVTDYCGMGLLLQKMPWNQVDTTNSSCNASS